MPRTNRWTQKAVSVSTTGAALDVGGGCGIYTITGTTSGRTITSISNGSAGHWVVLVFGDGNVTLTTAAANLNGAVNAGGTTADVLFLATADGTTWYEAGRSRAAGSSGPASFTTVTASGTATFNGNVIIGDAAADTLDINATISDDFLIDTNKKIQFRDTGIFIQSGADGKVTISSDGSGTDDITLSGTITLDDDLITPTSKKIQFRDTGLFIQSGADGKLTISSDGSGADDITLSGTITLTDDLITPTDKKIQFRDTGLFIQSGADGKLTISADGSGADDISLSGTVTVTDVLTLNAGLAAVATQSNSPRLIHTGAAPPATSTSNTDATPVNTEVYISEVFVPANTTITGVAIHNGSAVAGNVKVGLVDSTGAVVATSASTAQSGTNAYQRIPFTGTYTARGPATFGVVVIFDTNTTPRYRAHAFGNFGAAKQTGQVFATGFTTVTFPTTFTADLGCVGSLY